MSSHVQAALRTAAHSRPSLGAVRRGGQATKRVRSFAHTTRRRPATAATALDTVAAVDETIAGADEGATAENAVKVKSVEGLRLNRGDEGFQLEYLLGIEEPDVNVWVPADNVAEDVREDYEAQWWSCCRQGDLARVEIMLKGGGQALVAARDKDDRSALHYACGVGSEECIRAILSYGAEVDAKDKDSFTPLHIAAGYLHEKIVEILVQSGANPELQDSTGRSPLDLVETLKLKTPATTVTFARRSVLESIAKTLEQYVFEEVPPAAIKDSRTTDSDQKEYLVQWLDDFSDSWVLGRDISDDLIQDFEKGLEYARMTKAYDPPSYTPGNANTKAKNRPRLVKWADDATPSWEAKENAQGTSS